MRAQRRQLFFTLVWIVGALLFAFGRPSFFGAGAPSSTGTALPAIPVDVQQVAAVAGRGSHGPSTTDALIAQAQQKALSTGTASDYNALAEVYMQKARETGDVTYYNLADQAVGHSLALNPGNFEGLTTAAWVKLARHDFRGAAALARRSLTVNAYHSETYGILGDAELELGDYKGATRDYQRMVDLKPGLASYNRASHMHWLYADTTGAIKIMRMAIAAGSSYPENVAWCQAQVGDDYFFLGAFQAAEHEYRASLRTFPHEIYALAGLARLYAGEGRYRDAVSYYNQVIGQIPLPQYVIALGDTYAQMGRPAQAAKQYALVDYIFHLYDVNHINIGIDRAQFYADHDRNLKEALQLARAEATWRHDIRTMDTLAWVLYKNHRYHEALAAEQQALRLGTRDTGYYYHLGLIYQALGDLPAARSYLQGALMLNPYFDVRQAPAAVAALRRLGSQPATRPVTAPTQSNPDRVTVAVGPRS